MKGRVISMNKILKLFLIFAVLLSVAACSPVDKNYGVSSTVVSSEKISESAKSADTVSEAPIMSSDRVMSKYFDISVFDEENYANIYLGKKFEINAVFAGDTLSVPTKLSELEDIGWFLADGNTYDKGSLVFAYETIDITLKNEAGVKLSAQMYNSSRSSVKLSECYVVKFFLENGFYKNPDGYNAFNINGITNSMAITDVIEALGTPSHFYRVSDNCYYLDYFITKKDRRNGITVYINPVDDLILSVEFSHYK